MCDLNKIVVSEVAAKWEDIAYALRYKILTVELIKSNHKDNINCCKELFKDWLTTDNGAKPKTWETMLNKLKEIKELHAVTESITEKLIQMDS